MTKKAANKVEKNWLEWIVFGVSLALVVGTLGYLLYDGATATEAPPSIQVRLGEQQRTPHNFIVHVAVTNDGGETAEGVHVEVVLESVGGETERGEFVVALLPDAHERGLGPFVPTRPRPDSRRASSATKSPDVDRRS